ncbi:1-acylglycerol-3-phosphate acyltransferase protein [Mucor ambiguus]|uniref:1-acyl-sn-glycerol-3-phosphate acyltransferase n=1 Tax=Mucor ambiguus TaxID=91626 RepID=A0A0C9M953_9FUNG|nr:1-acylglycerol-3-phosphate acyltransferase protein [Mucor ambiguus]
MAESGQLNMKVPWGLTAIIAPIVFQAIFRKRGGFMYRKIVAFILMGVAAFWGIIAGVTLPLIGRAHLINWTVAKVEAFLNKTFLAITATVEGKENLPKDDQTAIYVCNHQTVMDIMFMGNVVPKRVAVVAKKSIRWIPFLGWFMILSKTIFLDRGNRDSAIKQARQAALDIHRKKMGVWIFPEGTRSNSGKNELLPFKKGAFYMATQAKVPIIPIVIQNYKDIYNAKQKHFGYGDIKIRILPPVDTTDIPENSESVDKLTTDIRNQMLATLKEISPEQQDKSE